MKNRFILLLLTMLWIIGAVSAVSAAEAGAAENISSKCTYTFSCPSSSKKNLRDNRIKSYSTVRLKDGLATLDVTWKDTVSVGAFYLQWTWEAPAHTLAWYDGSGTLLERTEVPALRRLDQWVEAPDGARELTITAETEMSFSECTAYTPGHPPETVRMEEDTPEKLDYLLISTHPDDDQLFMGAVIPVYGGERGYTGTVLYMTCRERNRYEEALNGLRVAGLTNLALFAFKKDGGPHYDEVRKFWDYDETVATIVRYLREFKPEVVITHDLMGEYGHALHRITSEAVTEAVERAAESGYDPGSEAEFGTWQVKKLYLHLYGENKLTIDMEAPLAAYDGQTALEVASAAYKEHESQQYLWFYVSDTGIYSAAEYGLAYTTVGLDTPGRNDMFEHIDPSTVTGRSPDAAAEEAQTGEAAETAATAAATATEETQQDEVAGTTATAAATATEETQVEEATAETAADESARDADGAVFECAADAYGTVHFAFRTPMTGVYLSRTETPPDASSGDWQDADADGMTAAVWKSDGTYNAFAIDGDDVTYGPVPVTVASGIAIPLDGEGTEAANEAMDLALAANGSSIEAVNEKIAAAAVSAGLYSRAAVASAAVTAVSELGKAGLAVPYRSAGRYDEEDDFGILAKWGSALPKTERDNNGKYYVYGLHCAASSVFAYKQAGLNLTSSGKQPEVFIYGRMQKKKTNQFNRRYAQAGDILKTETTHTMMVLERRDSDGDGKDDAFLVLEMDNPKMIIRQAPFRRSYDAFDMTAVFDDTGWYKDSLAWWPGSFRIPLEELPEVYRKAAE